MQIEGVPKAFLRQEAREYINLYASLGERAEVFLPNFVFDNLKAFVRLCYEEPTDPARQQAEIQKYLLKFREDIPGYSDITLMLYPHQDSKAFIYSSLKQDFNRRLGYFADNDIVNKQQKEWIQNIQNFHDLSVGTPPVTEKTIEFLAKIVIGDSPVDLRRFRDVIGVIGDIDEAHWNYFMDTLEQMINQSTHYTTRAEKNNFLHRTEWAVNFKGLNGLIRTVVSGNSDIAVELIKGEVFGADCVRVVEDIKGEELFELMQEDTSSVFVVKVKHMRKNMFAGSKWFPLISRIVVVDDSPESRASNTSLVFSFHNGIINTLNKVHTKKLGAPANTQLNLRLILENVNSKNLQEFKELLDKKIADYNQELEELKKEQLGQTDDLLKNINLFKFDSFSRQILKDRYSLARLRDFIQFIQNTAVPEKRQKQNQELIQSFEERIKKYFYSDIPDVQVATILEGGGRNQIRTYGEYLLKRKLKPLDDEILERCKTIINFIPDNYKRTLHNHFHKNFGVNLFLEKYQKYIAKVDNESDNQGRFRNVLIDLGVYKDFERLGDKEKQIIKDFISDLNNLDKTSISDDVQMIIRDLLYYRDKNPKPYIIYNKVLAWEYTDLFSDDKFYINPFDIEIENLDDQRIDYERLLTKLSRIKNTLQLFDSTGSLWDRFCENVTIIINDPSNPTGYSDFNRENLIAFLKFVNNSKITLLLDEAYTDSVKVPDEVMPKWRSISRYIFNNESIYSKIRAVSSLSTTKNLAGSGERLGLLVATPAMKEVIDFARERNQSVRGNSCSLYFLNAVLETGLRAKYLKDKLESKLPKDASRSRIVKHIENFIIDLVKQDGKSKMATGDPIVSGFEGSPLHLFLLDELVALAKLDILGLPDDFKYKDVPFYIYYRGELVKGLDRFRINKNFRNESNLRLKTAIKIAEEVIQELDVEDVSVIRSDGSYLFNLLFRNFGSFNDLEDFTKKIAGERGISALPYKTGVVRFSLGGYIEGTPESYEIFKKELRTAFTIFLSYWKKLKEARQINPKASVNELLDKILNEGSKGGFPEGVFEDYAMVRDLKKKVNQSLRINENRSLYHASPQVSGVSITTIGDSKNSVIEFQGDVGNCRTVEEFIRSRAFTKIYENLLPQIYKKIPQLRNLNFNIVASRFSKATILKYINNKKTFHPNHYVLDDPEEKNIMREILIEMERLLFSDTKMKILTLQASGDYNMDVARLEGVNMVLKKHIQEILLHFNLPFEQPSIEPSRREIITTACELFEEVTGLTVQDIDLERYLSHFIETLRQDKEFASIDIAARSVGFIADVVKRRVFNSGLSVSDQILYLYLLKNDSSFFNQVTSKLRYLQERIDKTDDADLKIFTENVLTEILPQEVDDIMNYIIRKKDIKVDETRLSEVTQKVVGFLIFLQNLSKGTDYYHKYTHTLIKVLDTYFRRQNSDVNEMIQHGITLYRNFEVKDKTLKEFDNGRLVWINEMMTKCGVISVEQSVQRHTRISTDAKKREYPFHKVDRGEEEPMYLLDMNRSKSKNDYIKALSTKPSSRFFERRLARFVANMDPDDYRCKIMKNGVVTQLIIFQKGYIKYLTDFFRLTQYQDISLKDAETFVPDVLLLLGAPEKVISFPQIGYFDIQGPKGNIKTLVTPLRKEADYFGDVKKPWLTMINEKVKEMGGIPKHGSLFAIELEDGSIFVVEVDGDSGVGKSEMLAGLTLKWLRQNLPGVRSIKNIAGDMFHVFRDKEGNLYGFGTEEGDFSRVTDFDPEYIKYYKYLFESSADSNVDDLNSRSTISGICEIHMPYKIDIILTAHNNSKEDAGIIRVSNPENFLLYIDSHGERKEKATSQDGPHFQRTLLRYTADKNIVDVLAQHGNYLDDVLDWELDPVDGKYYLASSYKMMDKIDIEEVVRKIFIGKEIPYADEKWKVTGVSFDLVKNRFIASIQKGDKVSEVILSRNIFSSIFDSLASTPAGQPFVSQDKQIEGRYHLIDVLKGGDDGKGEGAKIECGILSTEIGKKGKEISGPQKAAESLTTLIKELRAGRAEINQTKNKVRRIVKEKYAHVFTNGQSSNEIWRYNFYLYQLDKMMKAEFVRMDDPSVKIDLSGVNRFKPKDKNEEFSPLLVTPNLNIELSSFGETCNELMSLPNYPDFAQEFLEGAGKLYVAKGYSEETIVNNMITQLLLMDGYIEFDDLMKGRITEKVNRETIAAAKYAVLQELERRKKEEKSKPAASKAAKPDAGTKGQRQNQSKGNKNVDKKQNGKEDQTK
ncbi:aminotransferase class I/II-fold pyridoxal phosphate-dependent enzyme [Thermophagus xiamenensis]|uniref:Aminotransferase class I and II n=1 Tax=Thermophagus xiamenensis TaxID=385682 RepID=A0A1I2BGS7_9BACT|nr:aminotransferase class I/II-fold pyridoxal phosphate-dependent enzyme [Thermophagus xiamenensis]SFE55326.1 Aminotransferase class I and II [Thermophagus xiamenensis]